MDDPPTPADDILAHLADSGPSGPVPTLWGSDGIAEAFEDAAPILESTRPAWVQLHTWEPAPVAAKLRALLPGVGLICGHGIDGIARRVALGQWTVRRGIAAMRDLARVDADCGAAVVCWNAEASWKRPPTSDEAARLHDVIRGGLAVVASTYPALRQWHTAYDHPSYHSTYPWRAWLGAGSPIEVSLPQVYAAGDGTVQAHRGALPRREKAALASWGAAVRAGWIVPDDPSTALREGVLWRPYLQAHDVVTCDTVSCAVAYPVACLWAIRDRSDAAGRAALGALCELWRRRYWGPDAVRRFQASAGLVPDGIVGPLTLGALGIT